MLVLLSCQILQGWHKLAVPCLDTSFGNYKVGVDYAQLLVENLDLLLLGLAKDHLHHVYLLLVKLYIFLTILLLLFFATLSGFIDSNNVELWLSYEISERPIGLVKAASVFVFSLLAPRSEQGCL